MSNSISGQTQPPPLQRILALDLGIGSYGIALQERSGEGDSRQFSFPIVRSCTLPGDWGQLKTERTRRRMWRTRTSHLEREKWLRKVFSEDANMPEAVLRGQQSKKIIEKEKGTDGKEVIVAEYWRLDSEHPADYRLEREFPPRPGKKTKDKACLNKLASSTVYSGAALRCLLLLGEKAQIDAQGRKLEPWQVFKALHSAIQKRGYDPYVPWKRAITRQQSTAEAGQHAILSDEEKREQEDEQASMARASKMDEQLKKLHELPRYQRPCFWEAQRMLLWSKENPEKIELRTKHNAASLKWADEADPAVDLKKREGDQKPTTTVHPALEKKLPVIFHRETIEQELLELCIAAGELLPALKGKEMHIMYGPPGWAYPNVRRRNEAEESKRIRALAEMGAKDGGRYARGELRGKWVEYQGALAQKAPTFDNRGPGPCVLIKRYHSAKCDLDWDDDGKIVLNDKLLAAEVSFLLQVKNFRFTPGKPDSELAQKERDWLSATEIRRLYQDHFRSTVIERMHKPSLKEAITKTDLTNWLNENVLENARPKPGQEDSNDGKLIDKPRVKGRSRMSRPALRLVRALLLSGLSPKEFHGKLLQLSNADELVCEIKNIGTWGQLRYDVRLVDKEGGFYEGEKARLHGLVVQDLDFLASLGDSWEQISIRDERLQTFNQEAQQDDQQGREDAINRMIAAEVNPIIRHRLGLLNKLLTEFLEPDKRPERVVVEFVRDEFMGRDSEKKRKLIKFQNDRRDANILARSELGRDATDAEVMRWQLLKDQGGACLLCGCTIGNPKSTHAPKDGVAFDQTHLAHIVAKSRGGPRAYNNLTVACAPCNARQDKDWHAVWMAREGVEWDSFVTRVERSKIGGFKKKLLCTRDEKEAMKMIQSRAALQQTAWIAKLSQVLVCLKFGWSLNFEGQERRVVVVPGSATNQVAQKYKLYRVLGEPGRVEALEAEIDKERAKLREMYESDASPEKMKVQRLAVRKAFEALDKKCRDDKRHHALDAMVLSFLPHWAADGGKREIWFGLPNTEKDWQAHFRRELSRVMPEPLRIEKPVLGETIYGMRQSEDGSYKAVLRREVIKMAYGMETLEGELKEFGVAKLKKTITSIRDNEVRKMLLEIAERLDGGVAGEKQWLDTVRHLRLKPNGPLIKKVTCWADKGDIVNYKDLSKRKLADGSEATTGGQWCRTKKEDRGKWIYWAKPKRGTKPSLVVRSVRVFESARQVEDEVRASNDVISIVGFFQSGCLAEILRTVTLDKPPKPERLLSKGRYEILGVKAADGRMTLRAANGEKFEEITMSKFTSPDMPNIRRLD